MVHSIISNEAIKQVFIGIPSGHKHLRILMQVGEKWLVFPEAVLANLVRGYIEIVTHPQRRIVHLVQKTLEEQKENFAAFQLIEHNKPEENLQQEFDQIWKNLTDKT